MQAPPTAAASVPPSSAASSVVGDDDGGVSCVTSSAMLFPSTAASPGATPHFGHVTSGLSLTHSFRGRGMSMGSERSLDASGYGGGSQGCRRVAHHDDACCAADDDEWDSPPPCLAIGCECDDDDDGVDDFHTESPGAVGAGFELVLHVHDGTSPSAYDDHTAPFDFGQPRHGLAVIVDGVLLLGSYRDTVDAAECARLGVGAFLCVAAGCAPPPHALESGAPTLSLALADDATERLADHIPAACAFIEAQAAAGRRTAIFCRKGRSRSVSLAIAFVMRRTGMSAQEALDHVAARYDRAEPNFAFLRQLGIVGSSNSGGP